jgi:predicted ATPase/DNA-binding winged helix-turn-helix (wHTH) protein
MNTGAETFSFGAFRLFPARRALLFREEPVPVRSRPFDLLVALVRNRDRVLSKDELMELVWPGRIVEDGNLTVHVAGLRKVLGPGIIATLPGHGYRFVAKLDSDEIPRPPTELPTAPTGNLPQSLSRLIGREKNVERVGTCLRTGRLVTVVGPGGVGKTRVALAAAEQLRDLHADGTWLIDLSSVAGAAMVPAAIASALGIEIHGGDRLQGLCSAVATKKALLVLDGCEPMLGPIALAAEALLRSCPSLVLLATSRESLRVEGEILHRLDPLVVGDEPVTPEAVAASPAVELFLERARAADADFTLTPENAPLVLAICRRLDGIPLAIELAAPRLASFGLEHLAARLEDRFSFLTGGRRTALPRHQTLAATLDWSFRLLTSEEEAVLRRLAVFVGGFTIEAAEAVGGAEEMTAEAVFECLSNLIAKSLVSIQQSGEATRYRLLDTTRAYVRQKLKDSNDLNDAARRHAQFFRGLLEQAEQSWAIRSTADWLATYRQEVDNISAALDWTFSPDGDLACGISLASAAVGLMFDLGFLETCRSTAERALEALTMVPEWNLKEELRLQSALAALLVYVEGPGPTSRAPWLRALELAHRVGDVTGEARALWGLWNDSLYGGAPREAGRFAEKYYQSVAGREDGPGLLSHRLIGITRHYLGNQDGARTELEFVVRNYARELHRWNTVGFRVDHNIVARSNLARVLWVQGHWSEAASMLAGALDDALAYEHQMTLQYVLTEAAIPLALLGDDFDEARRCLGLLLTARASSGFHIWECCGRCFAALLDLRVQARGASPDTGAAMLRLAAALHELRDTGFTAHLTLILGLKAEALCRAGAASEAQAAVKDARARCDTFEEQWYMPELWRIDSAIMLRLDQPQQAAIQLQNAIDHAGKQGAHTWQLRAATDLAQIYSQLGDLRRAVTVLRPIYELFPADGTGAELQAARAVLDRCV